jgi:hypothetical protein
VQAAKRDEDSLRAIVVGNSVSAIGIGDVDLDHYEIRPVVDVKALNVFIADDGLVIGAQISGERGEAERREERILDGTEVRTGGFGQSGKNELGADGAMLEVGFHCESTL